MPYYEFVCGCGRVTAKRTGYNVERIKCGCGTLAPRRPFYLAQSIITEMGGVFNPDPERFVDRAEEIDYAYEKASQEVGAAVAKPKWYRAGLTRAKARLLAGEGSERNKRKAFELAGRDR